MAFVLLFTLNTFAYTWYESNGNWYILLNDKGEVVKDALLDTGTNVYFFDSTGKLMTGWWKDRHTDKIYFFDNKKGDSLGGMVFGLHEIDGYKHYFADDGSLVTATTKGSFVKAYKDYYADYYGYLYFENQLQRDMSIAKSEYYTNTMYYDNIDLNNYYLARGDEITDMTILRKMRDEVKAKSNDSGDNYTTQKSADTHKTSGGLNYYVDEYGRVKTYGDIYETQEAEKYGPMMPGY